MKPVTWGLLGAVLTILLITAFSRGVAQEEKARICVKSLPPVVVRTSPESGDTQVDAAKVTEIRVTFSKEMADKSWSWTQLSDETYPKTTGEIAYLNDRRTCVTPVRLEPGKIYAIWLNSNKYHNFRDSEGKPALPYLLVFETRPFGG